MNIHENARTTPASRYLLVQRVGQGWSVAEAAEAAGITGKTARKWLHRHASEGRDGLRDRSSAALRRPHALPNDWQDVVVYLRGFRQPARAIAHQLVFRAQPSARCWRGVAWVPGPASSRPLLLAATSVATPEICSIWTSRSWVDSEGRAIESRERGWIAAPGARGGNTSTSRSTTSRGSPTSRSCPMKPGRVARTSCAAPKSGSLHRESKLPLCLPTTALGIVPIGFARHAWKLQFAISAHAPTHLAPTERPSASSKLFCANGPTSGPTATASSEPVSCRFGFASTMRKDPMAALNTNHQSADDRRSTRNNGRRKHT